MSLPTLLTAIDHARLKSRPSPELHKLVKKLPKSPPSALEHLLIGGMGVRAGMCEDEWQGEPNHTHHHHGNSTTPTDALENGNGTNGNGRGEKGEGIKEMYRKTRGDAHHQDDSPDDIAFPIWYINDPQTIKEAQEELEKAVMIPDPSINSFHLQALVLIGKIHYCKGIAPGHKLTLIILPGNEKYVDCIVALNQVPLSPAWGGPGFGYVKVLILQGIMLKGLSYERASKFTQAEHCYEQALSMTSLRTPMDGNDIDEWTLHIEKPLYRLPLLRLRRGQTKLALSDFRTYLMYLAPVPLSFRPRKRLSLIRNYIHLLLFAFRKANYPPPTPIDNIYAPKTMEEELVLLYALQSELVKRVSTFPEAEVENKYVEEVYESLMLGAGMLGKFQGEDIGLLRTAIQETLHGATYYTFQCTSLLRLMAYNALSTNNQKEAFLAITAYLDRDSFSTKATTLALDAPITPHAQPYRDLATVCLAAARASLLDGETVQAIRYAEKGFEFAMKEHVMKCRAYWLVGLGYACRGVEVFDPETRRIYQGKSLDTLTAAVTEDPEAWEVRFSLAILYCDTRENKRAIESIKACLTLNAIFIPGWHLLVLLLSSLKQTDKALKICELSLKKCADCGLQHSTAALSLFLTYTLLIEQVHGADQALGKLAELFKLYSNVFHPLHTSHTPVLPSPMPLPSKTLLNVSRSTHERNRETLTPRIAAEMKANLPKNAANASISFGGKLPRYKEFFKGVSHEGDAGTRSEALRWLVKIWIHSSSTFRRSGKYDMAVESWIEAAKVDPESADVWCELGVLHLSHDDINHEEGTSSISSLQESLHCFQTALAIEKDHLHSSINLGQTYYLMGKMELAEHILEGATKQGGGTRHEAWYWYAMVLKETGRLEKAATCLQYALSLEGTAPIGGGFDEIWRCSGL